MSDTVSNIALHDTALPLEHAEPRSRVAEFYELTKPRMNFLVLVTTAVGYYMAVRTSFDWMKLIHALFGTALCAASAAILNQYIEREHDARMPRTRNRPLVTGRIAPGEALLLCLACGVAGVLWLALLVNLLTALLGLFTILSYAFIYTPLKRISSLNTIIGAVPGAIPPVMGWTAVYGALSPEAVALFAILFLWQMPHFLAIAILYRDDYAAGGFKMLPNVDPDLSVTSRQIVVYSLALIPATLLPVGLNLAGPAYFTAAMLMGLAFLTFGIDVATTRNRATARRLFFASIIYLPLLLAALMLAKV